MHRLIHRDWGSRVCKQGNAYLVGCSAARLALLRSRRRRLRQRFLVAPAQRCRRVCRDVRSRLQRGASRTFRRTWPRGRFQLHIQAGPCARRFLADVLLHRQPTQRPHRTLVPGRTRRVGRARRPLRYKSRWAHRLVRRPAHSPRAFEALLRNSRAYALERARPAGFVHVRLASPHTRSSPTVRFQLRGHS